jgi:hypothetical protein
MWSGAGYEIDDPRPIAASAPYTFFLPPPSEVSAVGIGDLIKATVRISPPSAEWEAERLWFSVIEKGVDVFKARLESDPEDMPSIPKGTVIDIPRAAIIDLIFADDRPRADQAKQYWDRCLVDSTALKGMRLVEYIYRERPEARDGDRYPDSGWRIRASTLGLSAKDAEEVTVEYVALGAVLNKDDSWLHLLDAPEGSAFLRDFDRNIWVEEKG